MTSRRTIAGAATMALCLGSAAPAPSQQPRTPSPFAVAIDGPLGPLLAAATRRLEALDDLAADEAPRALSGRLLGALWMGRDHLAARLLQQGVGRALAPVDAAWSLVHHYWHLRATHDPTLVRTHRQALEAAAALVDNAAATDFGAAVLFLHATACAGALRDTADRIAHPERWLHGPPAERPGADAARRAAAQLAVLERRFWAPHLAAFTADGSVVEPMQSLLPCWIGMLATTGDKTLDNARGALLHLRDTPLPSRSPTAVGALPGPSMALVAAAQLDLDLASAIDRVHRAVAAADADADASAPPDLGAAVDAVLFALTGVRLASGPGIDEDWVRVRPRLPPDCDHFSIRGLRRDGWSAELACERRRGPPTADERDLLQRCAAEVAGGADRVRGTLVLRSADPAAGSRRIVAHCEGRTFVGPARRGERFEFAAPLATRPPPEVSGASPAAPAPGR